MLKKGSLSKSYFPSFLTFFSRFGGVESLLGEPYVFAGFCEVGGFWTDAYFSPFSGVESLLTDPFILLGVDGRFLDEGYFSWSRGVDSV